MYAAQSESRSKPDMVAPKHTAANEEDVLRAQLYHLLAHYLSGPPTNDDLAVASQLEAAPGTVLGDGVLALAAAARETTQEREADAYQRLFIGLGRGVFVPYGSYYLTGFLHEKPLARLRADMETLGIVRDEGVSEPEDHVASVLEMMAGLLSDRFGLVSKDAQRRFFEAHVGSWAGHFLRDLSLDKESEFYAALGSLGARFIEVEERAHQMS